MRKIKLNYFPFVKAVSNFKVSSNFKTINSLPRNIKIYYQKHAL